MQNVSQGYAPPTVAGLLYGLAESDHEPALLERPVSLPVGFTAFPGELFQAPRSWVEKTYPNLTYYNQVDKGGHFAAWEEPALFSEEIRAAFRSLR